nr:hypothetical protein [Oscillospiraceae bacterium]
MEKNKGIERLSDDFLDQVVGGVNASDRDITDWRRAIVRIIGPDYGCSTLFLRQMPNGPPMRAQCWKNGDPIFVSSSRIEGNWIMAKANDGAVGWVDSKCVHYM